MATVTVHVDEKVLEETNRNLSGLGKSLDAFIADTLRDYNERVAAQRRFEEMAAEINALGIEFPILNREQRNARR